MNNRASQKDTNNDFKIKYPESYNIFKFCTKIQHEQRKSDTNIFYTTSSINWSKKPEAN